MSETTNPYSPGQPVANPAWLFGRQDAADWVELQIQAQARVIILSAQPHIGKSSFVKHVGALQTQAAIHTLVMMPDVLDELGSQTKHPKHRFRRGDNNPATLEMVLVPFLKQLLPQLAIHDLVLPKQARSPVAPTASALRELFEDVCPKLETPLVLCIDDLHHLVAEDMALLATFLSAFMPVLDQCPRLYLLFTINEEALRQIHHPLLDSAPTFNLGVLTPDASVNMITTPVKNVLRFDYGITRRIAEVSSHHPYYLTLFCATLLNRQGHDGWVNQRDFDAALAEILGSPIEPFKTIWDQASWVERAVLASIAAMQGKHGPVMQQEVIRFLQGIDNNVVPEVVINALNTLASRGVLVPMGAISYRFYVELLRLWLREHTDLAEILREVDWPRLDSQLKLTTERDRAVSPPIASQRPGRRRISLRSFLISAAVMGLASVCALLIGAVFAVQYLDVPLTAFVGNPFTTPTLLPSIPEDELAANELATITPAPLTGSESGEVDEAAAATPAVTPSPTPALVMARTLPSITYMARDIDQTWQIYVMNADGSGEIVLSEQGQDDTTPIWSPNGQKIALVSRRDGNREIYIMDVETKEVVNISRHPADDWTPAWSPDGSQLAFSSIRAGRWEIFSVATACFELPDTCRESLRQVTADSNSNISPVWSPDGTRFAFNSKASGNWDIYTMNIDGSDIRQITTSPENDLSPAWSPDGTQLAFESNREGNVELFIIDSNGATPARNITNLSFADDHGPTWSPDGQSIVFYSNREGNWDIFSATLDGQTIINLTQTPSRDEQTPAWRP